MVSGWIIARKIADSRGYCGFECLWTKIFGLSEESRMKFQNVSWRIVNGLLKSDCATRIRYALIINYSQKTTSSSNKSFNVHK